jgi:glutamine synthetase adenylyltransferase
MLLDLNTHDLDGNYGRFPEKALRIAALFASLGNSSIIDLNHWARAQQIVERWRRNLHELYNQVNEENITKPKLTSLEKVKKAFNEKEEPTEREIVQYTGLSYDEVAQLLQHLEEDSAINHQKVGRTVRYRLTSQTINQEKL